MNGAAVFRALLVFRGQHSARLVAGRCLDVIPESSYNKPVERTGSSRFGQVHSHDCGGCSPSLTFRVGLTSDEHERRTGLPSEIDGHSASLGGERGLAREPVQVDVGSGSHRSDLVAWIGFGE